MCFEPGASGRPFRLNMEVGARCTCGFSSGSEQVYGVGSGGRAWRNTTSLKGSPGVGSPLTRPWGKPRLVVKQRGRIRRTGGKKGVKRHVLTDGRGVPLSLVVTGANVHDQKGLAPLLAGIVAKRPKPRKYKPQTMCLDKGYDTQPCRHAIERRGYRDGIKSRGIERQEKRNNPNKRARRWVVERTHSGFTNWRKILVRYERKACNYLALLHIAAAIAALRTANVLG